MVKTSEGKTVDTYEQLRTEAASALATFEEGLEETTAVLALPGKYRRGLRTTNIIERLIEELRRRVDTSSAPTGLSAESQDGSVSLNWNAVGGGDVTGYNVYRSTNRFSEASEASKVNESPLENPSYADEEVTNGTTYYYRTVTIAEANGVLGIGGGTKESKPSEGVEKTRSSRGHWSVEHGYEQQAD